ncbi:MAG: hypothetical protein AB1758_15245 [Candidatus Eremiobacterota bacterium]
MNVQPYVTVRILGRDSAPVTVDANQDGRADLPGVYPRDAQLAVVDPTSGVADKLTWTRLASMDRNRDGRLDPTELEGHGLLWMPAHTHGQPGSPFDERNSELGLLNEVDLNQGTWTVLGPPARRRSRFAVVREDFGVLNFMAMTTVAGLFFGAMPGAAAAAALGVPMLGGALAGALAVGTAVAFLATHTTPTRPDPFPA